MPTSFGGPTGPDTFQTTTSYQGPRFNLPGGGGAGLPDLSGIIKQRMERDQADRAAADRLRRMGEMRMLESESQQRTMRGAGGPMLRRGGGGESTGRGAMDWSQYGPPMKYVYGPGIIPGQVMDPNAMNYQQRQMFLPQSAGISGGDPAGLRQASEAQELQNQMQRMRLAGMGKGVERRGGF